MSDLESMCNIDNGTYTDAPVLTADVRKLFERIAKLDRSNTEYQRLYNEMAEEYSKQKRELTELRELLTLIRDDLRMRSEDGVVDISDFIWTRRDKALLKQEGE